MKRGSMLMRVQCMSHLSKVKLIFYIQSGRNPVTDPFELQQPYCFMTLMDDVNTK